MARGLHLREPGGQLTTWGVDVRVQFENLVQLYRQSCHSHADRPVLGTKRDGQWVWTSYSELEQLIDRCRGGLAASGVGPNDVVAIISNNRLEWAALCYATYGLEATFVPMYEEQLSQEWKYILNDCGAKVVVASTSSILGTLDDMRDELPGVQRIVCLDAPANDERSLAAWLAAGDRAPMPALNPSPEAVAGIIYTSGTTGLPKGVCLTHRNIASNVNAVSEVFPLEPDHRSLSFLPWAHSYGQTAELHYLLSQGASAAINDRVESLVDNLAEVEPTILVAVPRVFNRIYDLVHEQVAERPAFVQRMFYGGIVAASKRAQGEHLRLSERIELSLDDRLIFRKVRARFGGRLQMVISAAAALNREVAELIDALGIVFYEGYGLSETSPVVSLNRPGARRLGSVGKVIPGVRVSLDESASPVPGEGEIVVYGPNVMRGYHNRPEENAKVFTEDGGLRTGDLGRRDEEGFLYVTGRIKEQYKLENGKYVMPALLEEELKLSPYISNVMVHGENRPFNVAVVVPDMEAVKKWAAGQDMLIRHPEKDARVRELILSELRKRSAGFRGFEVPMRVLIVTDDFTTDNGELTPTLKLKRRNVEARYREALNALYLESAHTYEDLRIPVEGPRA